MNFFFISAVILLIAAAPSALAEPTKEDVDFVRTSCATTEYQRECFEALSHYAAAAQGSPVRLIRLAIAVALSKAKAETAYFNSLSKKGDYGAAAASAVRDCFSLLDDVVGLLQDSLNQMQSLVSRGSGSFQFQMSNVQTWMSGALASEDTCKDGFEGITESPVKSDVFDRVQRIEAATTNALALVNRYAGRV